MGSLMLEFTFIPCKTPMHTSCHLPARLAATFILWTLLLHRKLRGMVAPPENAIKPQLHSKKEPLQLPLPGDVIAENKVQWSPLINLRLFWPKVEQ